MSKKHSNLDSIVRFEDYKECLKFLLNRAEEKERGQRSALARAMGCQPAYLSRVLNADGELSLEQIEVACRHFRLNVCETQYLIALTGENRAGTLQIKDYWRRQRKFAQQNQSDLKGRLNLEDTLSDAQMSTYYGSWHFAAIHIATSIPHLQTAQDIAEYLSLPKKIVREALDFLQEAGLVVECDGQLTVTERDIHLARTSPMASRHHLNWRLKSIESMAQFKENALRYSGVISLSAEDVDRLKELILNSIQQTREIVKNSKEEVLGCYSFEFFELGKHKEVN